MLKNSIYLLIVAIFLASCEKTIDISVNDTDQIPVIEATLNGTDSLLTVRITKTANYLGNDTNPVVENAKITLIQPSGEELSVPHDGDGVYTARVIPVNNKNYTLEVEIDGETHKAESSIPDLVVLDSIGRYETDFGPPEDVGTLIAAYFREPGGIENYYHVLYSINDVQESEILAFDDLGIDGTVNPEAILFAEAIKGDVVDIEMRSITQMAFEYYDALADVAGASTDAAAPGNPNSNWGIKVVGFFNTYTTSKATLSLE